MKVLLVHAPSRRHAIVPPLGLLQVGAILEAHGHVPLLYDPLVSDPRMNSNAYVGILDAIDRFKPDVVGYGGIATSYGSVKTFSALVKRAHPGLKQIAGGPLSSVYDLLLNRAGIDVVVHGEAEISLPILLSLMEREASIEEVPGISFLDKRNQVRRNAPAEQLRDLDSIPLPAYHLVDLPRYFRRLKASLDATGEKMSEAMGKIGEDDRWIEIVTGRGCTHRCLFCYRHMKGIRYHSPQYVVRHLKFLMDKYGIRGFQFSDELFNATRERGYEICAALREAKLDIFFTIAGARVDRMDAHLIRELKEVGCVEISYGQESGSDRVLKAYKKGITAEQNREITKLTKSMGLNCPVQIVIGAPNETNETIRETIKFLKEVRAFQYSLNYLIPLPETPIWSYVEEKRLITDVERYLDEVALYGGQPIVNLTGESNRVWRSWKTRIGKEMRLGYLKEKGNRWRYLWEYMIYSVALIVLPFFPTAFTYRVKSFLRSFLPRHA